MESTPQPRALTDDQRKHLDFVQGVITRLARNSFLIKGWTITLAAAVLAVAVDRNEAGVALLAFLPGLTFWGLDAYYLRQERLFRKLYEAAISPTGATAVYSMDSRPHASRVASWWRTLLAPTVLGLHGVVIATTIGAMLAVQYG